MQTRCAWVLLFTLGACSGAGCTRLEPSAAAPGASDAHQRDRQIKREQRGLERRRLQLENRVLAELRKLRESRQASTGDAEPARDDDAASTPDYELLVFGGASHE